MSRSDLACYPARQSISGGTHEDWGRGWRCVRDGKARKGAITGLRYLGGFRCLICTFGSGVRRMQRELIGRCVVNEIRIVCVLEQCYRDFWVSELHFMILQQAVISDLLYIMKLFILKLNKYNTLLIWVINVFSFNLVK